MALYGGTQSGPLSDTTIANPPFNPNETVPSNTGVVAIFPQQERDFRDIIESWLLVEHGRYGFHSFNRDTTVNRDANANRPAGSLFFNTTLNVLQFMVADTPSPVWDSVSFPPGTRLLFNNSAPPVGWTKIVDAAYNDAMVRIVTGTPAAPSGTKGMSEVFIASFGVSGNTNYHELTISELPAHGHPTHVGVANQGGTNMSGGIALAINGQNTYQAYTGVPNGNAGQQVGGTGGGQGHRHGIAFNLDLFTKRVEFILCEKDTFA